MNLFNLLPTVPQETRNLYYEAGASSPKELSRIGTADAPYIESFEEMMARVREKTSIAERGGDPGAKPAEPGIGTDHIRDNKEESGHAEKPPVAGERVGSENPRVEGESPGKKKRLGEDVFAGEPSLGMVRPDNTGQSAVEDALEEAADGAAMPEVMPDEETGGTTAVDIAVPDVKGEPAFSPKDGIPFTDTYPLFDNKPDVRGTVFEAPVDDVPVGSPDDIPASDLIQNSGVMLANGAILDEGEMAADVVRQNRDAKDGFSEEALKPQVPPESDHQLVSFVNNAGNTENGDNSNDTASKKKGGSRKLTVEVADMRSDSEAPVRGGETKTATLVKDISVDMKGALLGSLGDGASLTPSGSGLQTSAGFDQSGQPGNAGMKSAAQLESFLSRELQGGLNGDIVRQAAVMLRDGGEGLIRLQLHPESLGNVRIKLALSGNKVEGIITVESPEAMNAFERELASLEMAFRDSGFEGASLNMQMSGGKSGGDLFDGVQAGAFSQVIAASSYEASTVTAGDRSIYAHGGLSIFA
jgi:hypothetical protein